MIALLSFCRLLLLGVFLLAGITKLADRAGSQQALHDFGLPERLSVPGSLLLPLAELGIALALLPAFSAWAGALGALILLLGFLLAISLNLARGRKPDCHCFGQLHSEPIGWPTVLRNATFAILAALMVWQGNGQVGPNLLAGFTALTPTQQVGGLVALLFLGLLLAEGWLLLSLMRQNGRLLLRIEALEAQSSATGQAPASTPARAPAPAGLPVGSPAPAFDLPLLGEGRLSLDALCQRGKAVLLVFSDPQCGPCQALLPEIARWQKQSADRLTIALISRGTPEANRAKIADLDLPVVLLQQDREVAAAYQSNGTPGAVLVLPNGKIGSPLAMGAEAIKALVERTVSSPQVVALQPGDPAPALQATDLSGKLLELTAFRGRPTLLLFWHPQCGFCTRMLDDLRKWHAGRSGQSPELVLVSAGGREANQGLNLDAPIVLDEDSRIKRQYGASGTPSALLVDGVGKVAAPLAVGAPTIFALIGYQPAAPALAERPLAPVNGQRLTT